MLIIGGCKTGGGSSSGGGGGGADLSIPAAGPEDYTAEDYESLFKMWEAFSIAYTDADKTGSDDSNLCWAAAAANLLTWSGWAADEDDVFNTFNEHFANQPGYMYLEEDDTFVLMFTDSDDYLDQMRNFKTVWNDDTDRWEIQWVYGGVIWELNTPNGFFLAAGLGAAVHSGELDTDDNDKKSLGSRVLFRIPIEFGYQVTARHSLSILFDHVSNAYLASPNEGLDTIGIRYGYSF